jgi:hypothetical protein
VAEAVERCKECPALGRIDPIFDRHQYWPTIVLDLVAEDPRGPVQRAREIDIATGLQMPTPRDRDRKERAGGSDEMGERKTPHPQQPVPTAHCPPCARRNRPS